MSSTEMLMTFAQHGIQKTSVADLAQVAGVSRQALHKRFGSKQGVLEWVLKTFTEELFESSLGVLKTCDTKDPKQTILVFFESWSGALVPILSTTPHGASVLEAGMQFAHESQTNWESDLMLKLSEFLVSSGVTSSMDCAMEQTFTLNIASKGILLKSRSMQDFSRDMERVVSVVLSDLV
ncbi:TetR/AcrR family transcriptional regulator [Vibrio sp. JC009]|uniref:TetR/AcrR family transcriptional regulator n=1 Tax=Vibrio sp. JC009 TaxID=2912314 RepID=UPI0023B03573|nr:TetR/AcrR family transcriptional regulator [Vibrio sp. JC009]WED22979.1 TetR/AcrR family transcriptional regulator [Vibrio sp. JC009]